MNPRPDRPHDRVKQRYRRLPRHHRVHRFITGLRPVERHLTYYGHLPQIRRSGDRPADDCYYCHGLWRRAAHTRRK